MLEHQKIIVNKDMKMLPLGSACFVNATLTINQQLRPYKIYKSPFNGTRILTDKGVLPIQVFIEQTDYFKDIYCDQKNWKITKDGNDIQGHNEILNIRRCHLKKDNEFSFMLEVEDAFKQFENNSSRLILLVDLTDYMIFAKPQLESLKKSLSAYNTVYFIRDLQIDAARCAINKISNLCIKFDVKSKLEEIDSIFDVVHVYVPCRASNDEIMQYMSEVYSGIFEVSNENKDR